MMVWSRLMIWSVLACSVALLPHAARAQGAFREAVTLKTDGAVVKRLATVRDYVAERKWAEAIAILNEVSAQHPETLVAVAPGRYLPVPQYCNLILAGLPPEGRDVYRRQVDPQARQWMETARRTRDAALLEQVVRRAFVSSFGDDALLLLGDWAWEDGATAAARHHWQRMLPLDEPTPPGEPLPLLRYPDTDRDPALVRARIVLSYLMEGEFRAADAARQELAARHPDATGELAGRSGRLVEILEAVEREAQSWAFRGQDASVQTFALNAQRNKILPRGVDPGKPLYAKTLPASELPREEPAHRVLDRRPLSYFPVVLGRMLLLGDADRLYALDLPTGRPYYEGGAAGESVPDESLLAATVYRPVVEVAPMQPVVGVPWHTLTLHEGRLYARMGSPVTGEARLQLRDLPSDLICFDPVRDEGRLIWKTPASELGPGWAFEGAPIVGNGRVYAAARRGHPQLQIAVACFDAETGRLLWKRDVAAAIGGVDESFNLITTHLLTLAENTVFYSTDLGAIAALDAHDGTLRWVATYESRPEKDHGRLSDPFRQGLTPCLFHRGTVVAAPNDSDEVLALDAETGAVRWRTRLPDRIRHLLGVGRGRVVVSGDSVWGLDIDTGARVWGEARRDPEAHGYGRGLLVEDVAYWPQRERIAILDQRTGVEIDRIDLRPKGVTGGNLIIAEGCLVITAADRLFVLGEAGGPVERWNNLTADGAPSPADQLLRQAQAAEADGDPQAALDAYRRAAKEVRPEEQRNGEPLAEGIARRRYRLLMALAREATHDGRAAEAAPRFAEAAQTAPDAEDRLAALIGQATAEAARGHPRAAVAVWQQILSDGRLAELGTRFDPAPNPARSPRPGFSTRPAAIAAREAITGLIAQHGRAIYDDFDREADSRLRQAAESGDAERLSELLARYPNAVSHAGFVLQLAALQREQGNPLAAVATYRQALAHGLPPAERDAALRELARLWEQMGYTIRAAAAWRTWATAFPDAEIPHDGRRRTAAEFVIEHLAQPPYSRLAEFQPPLRRAWQRQLPTAATATIPQGTPPAPHLACLLVEDGGLQCVGLTDGATRWTLWPDAPLAWAAYAGPHLVLATTRGALRAVALETGQTRWEQPSPLAPGDAGAAWWRWAVVDGIIVGLDRGERIVARDADTGAWLWEFRPRTGTLQPQWLCDDRRIAVQLLRPDRLLVLNPADGRLRADHAADPEPWRTDPVVIAGEQLAVVTARKTVAALPLRPDGRGWTSDGPLSSAHVDPALWSDGAHLLLAVDGDTLNELDPETGRRLWSRPLASRPLPQTADAVALDGPRLYAVERGIVRCVDRTDGTLRWERYVGPGDGPFRVRTAGPAVLAYPAGRTTGRSAVQILDAETGRPIQSLAIPTAGSVRFHTVPTAAVLVAGENLIGFQPWTARAE